MPGTAWIKLPQGKGVALVFHPLGLSCIVSHTNLVSTSL